MCNMFDRPWPNLSTHHVCIANRVWVQTANYSVIQLEPSLCTLVHFHNMDVFSPRHTLTTKVPSFYISVITKHFRGFMIWPLSAGYLFQCFVNKQGAAYTVYKISFPINIPLYRFKGVCLVWFQLHPPWIINNKNWMVFTVLRTALLFE